MFSWRFSLLLALTVTSSKPIAATAPGGPPQMNIAARAMAVKGVGSARITALTIEYARLMISPAVRMPTSESKMLITPSHPKKFLVMMCRYCVVCFVEASPLSQGKKRV